METYFALLYFWTFAQCVLKLGWSLWLNQACNFTRVADLIMLLPVAEAKADLFDVERSNDGGGGGGGGDSGSNAGHSNSTSYIKNTVSSECECDARP